LSESFGKSWSGFGIELARAGPWFGPCFEGGDIRRSRRRLTAGRSTWGFVPTGNGHGILSGNQIYIVRRTE
jgi:hypothetical protein